MDETEGVATCSDTLTLGRGGEMEAYLLAGQDRHLGLEG